MRSRMLGDEGRGEVGELSSATILLGTGRGPRVATEWHVQHRISAETIDRDE